MEKEFIFSKIHYTDSQYTAATLTDAEWHHKSQLLNSYSPKLCIDIFPCVISSCTLGCYSGHQPSLSPKLISIPSSAHLYCHSWKRLLPPPPPPCTLLARHKMRCCKECSTLSRGVGGNLAKGIYLKDSMEGRCMYLFHYDFQAAQNPLKFGMLTRFVRGGVDFQECVRNLVSALVEKTPEHLTKKESAWLISVDSEQLEKSQHCICLPSTEPFILVLV